MGRHEAAEDGLPDPLVTVARMLRPEGGGQHSVETPRRGPLGWPGPEPDPQSKLGWPGDLVHRGD